MKKLIRPMLATLDSKPFKVMSRKQAIAIGLSKARKKGAKIPRAPKE